MERSRRVAGCYKHVFNASLVLHVLRSALSVPKLVGVKTVLLFHVNLVVRTPQFCHARAAIVRMWQFHDELHPQHWVERCTFVLTFVMQELYTCASLTDRCRRI